MRDMNNPAALVRMLNPFLDKQPHQLRWHPQRELATQFVAGRPAPQGSKNYLPGGGRESSPHLPAWRADVREAFTVGTGSVPGRAPVCQTAEPAFVWLEFVLARPKRLRAGQPTEPHLVRPDVDKLARGVLDALVSAGVLSDDRIVVHLLARKRYAEEGERTGCTVTVGVCALH